MRTSLRLVSVRLRLAAVVLAVIAGTAAWGHVSGWLERVGASDSSLAPRVEFFCPMCPGVHATKPSNCPTCGMALSERASGEMAAGSRPRRYSERRLALAGVRTAAVGTIELVAEFRTAGTVRFAEPGLTRVTARVDAMVERLAVEESGTHVARGDVVATIYSPEVYEAHKQLIEAARTRADARERGSSATVSRTEGVIEGLRTQLTGWGFPPEQIDAMAVADVASTGAEILSPYSGVVTTKHVRVGDYVFDGTPLIDLADPTRLWVVAEVHELDLALVRGGAEAMIRVDALPGVSLTATVSLVEPFLHENSRCASVRLVVDAPDARLLPGMSVDVTFRIPLSGLPEYASITAPAASEARVVYVCDGHDIVQDSPGECPKCSGMTLIRRELPAIEEQSGVLAVAESAVIDAGRRRVVYVEVAPDAFEARDVVLGRRCAGHYAALGGLRAGERVAVDGAFLLDADTRLNPAAAGTYFGASDHGAGTDK